MMCGDSPVLPRRLDPSGEPPADTSEFRCFRFGQTTVTALCDGYFPLAAPDILRSGEVPLDVLLDAAGLGRIVPSPVNAFLIDDGSRRVLIDAGAGDLQDATLGRLAARLEAAGCRPADIDLVLVTHLHPDHIGGLARDGEAVFPRAVVQVSREEAAYWLDPSGRDGVDASVRATFGHAREILAPYLAAGRCRWFERGASWPGGITAESLPGHTRGHTGFRLVMGGQDVVFCGDLFHVAAVQLAEPGVTVRYDSEPAWAQTTRKAFLAAACRRGDILGAAHAPFPGLGRVREAGRGYVWHPLV